MSSPQQPVRILITDDNPGDRELYRQFLIEDTDQEYLFFETGSGKEALEQCRSETLDCILLDYRLPDLDGLEFLSMLAADDAIAPIAVIMLTGEGNEQVAVGAMRAGAADYLPKKVLSTDSLKRSIANAVEKFRLRTAVEEQRKTLEAAHRALVHKHEELQRFYHTVSHELKTPLTSCSEFVAIVVDGLAGPVTDDQCEYLGLAKESCAQMTFRINDLLDSTRLETGKLSVNPQRAVIGETVSQLVASMAVAAHNKGISLEHVIQPDLPHVLIDNKRITQVLGNLVSNALKFTDEGGKVVVSAKNDERNPEYVLVSVSDTGRGIDPGHLDKIFDRLYQIKSGEATLEEGLGLGLSICRELVSLHRGEMFVESTPGKGSTFSFTVPKHSMGVTSDKQ